MASSRKRDGVDAKEYFPFLDLPAELRLLVYEHLLVANEPWQLAGFAVNGSELYPNIIATCQIVRQEATPVLYGCNEFEFTDRGFVVPFLSSLTDSVHHLSAITIDMLRFTRKEIKGALVLLKKCASLSKLTIGWCVWKSYEPEAFAKAIGPLARSLHKNQQRKQDMKTRDVLDGLHLVAGRMYNSPRRDVVERAAGFEKKVKDLLRATFK